MKSTAKTTTPATRQVVSKQVSKAFFKQGTLTKPEEKKVIEKNAKEQSQQPSVAKSDRSAEELVLEISNLNKVNQELEVMLKNKVNDIKKLQAELLQEQEKNEALQQTILKQEKEKKEVDEVLIASSFENGRLNEEIKKLNAILVEKERYITVLVKQNDGRLNIEEQFKIFDAPKRDSVKRNSIATSTIKQYQQANNIA